MSRPSRIFLIRHGESEGNLDHTVYDRVPDWRIGLTDTGREQARVAGRALRHTLGIIPDEPTSVQIGAYVSSYVRTRDTWDAIRRELAPAWISFTREDPRLREQEWGGGPRSGALRAEVEAERDAYGPFWYRFAGGEAGSDVHMRCMSFWETFWRDAEDPDFPANVAVITHAFTLRVLLMAFQRMTVDEFHALAKPANCATYELRLDGLGRYQLAAPFPLKDAA